jgi:hypothetical protein
MWNAAQEAAAMHGGKAASAECAAVGAAPDKRMAAIIATAAICPRQRGGAGR